MLSNIAAGVLLVSLRPFRAEEIVQIGTVTGTVEKVHLFSPPLLTADSKEVVIPNGKIISDNIVNYSRPPFRRTDQVDCRLKYADRGFSLCWAALALTNSLKTHP
ncbi:Small-conductance mechanosensitive channel [Citrobacter werkmanii]|uniref:Small-conductance mechanosensitive channel n=1 Tax=Citrobacter werkmanii TaxID=67827 RepID=A0A9N8CR46_9ENTR|nr:Small-conductance mechanosensitive channel [Citrobacter werkmanii]CAB5525312.1 Small-conductance mechanosensitive channel [Citrobacter werkmanii]CAB5535773.1 Small-conductance mechanosensitive channel [Citrobacter werkmanii]CAB5548921.1 Small-conductance mechanosensitive channel [Citrobacter werkmanii]CAB5553096.1 Small-conductance mechanosensitive channel [Citrobacter werkmanii]